MQIASHYGGTRNGLVISYPRVIGADQQGKIRDQWHHVIDIGAWTMMTMVIRRGIVTSADSVSDDDDVL
jgi:hypothetical protein